MPVESHQVISHYTLHKNIRALHVKAELKSFEQGMFSESSDDVPYTKGSLNAFERYYRVAMIIIRGEYMLWSTALPSNDANVLKKIDVHLFDNFVGTCCICVDM